MYLLNLSTDADSSTYIFVSAGVEKVADSKCIFFLPPYVINWKSSEAEKSDTILHNIHPPTFDPCIYMGGTSRDVKSLKKS